MHILRLNIDAIEVEHLKQLVAARTRESETLEFKATLPFQSQKGQPQQADRWIEQGDRIGEYARDQILSEMVAFANATGGTLVIGVVESDDLPREAVSLAPLPKCEELARRLLDAAEDIIEPRLPSLMARGIPIDETGQGYVVLRVGRSRAGPHRLNGKAREFYIRRGERAARMDVREIKSLTLELARSDERLEVAFQNRRKVARAKFKAISFPQVSDPASPLVARVSALPTLAENIEDLTKREELWWRGGPFALQFDAEPKYDISFPAREFTRMPRINLRSFVFEGDSLTRALHANGLVEAILAMRPRGGSGGDNATVVYVGWLLSLLVGALAQIEHLRRHLGWDTVEYGLEVDLWAIGPIHLLWDNSLEFDLVRSAAVPLVLPMYSVRDVGTFNDLINQFLQDLFNAWGHQWAKEGTIDWDGIIRRARA